MQTKITFRHLKSNPSLNDAANEILTKISKFNDNITFADVVFTQDVDCQAEIFLQVQGSTLIAKESSEDFVKSLNLASDKLTRQLRKHKTKDAKSKVEGIEY